jgi:hypothetical protein
MIKNVASQTWRIFAFDRTDNTPKTGDAAQITSKIAVDNGARRTVMSSTSSPNHPRRIFK